jgi:lactoylglutathione lyase
MHYLPPAGSSAAQRVAATLAYAILFPADLERSIGFYRDILGLPLRFSTDSYAEFETEGAKFVLYGRPHLAELIGRDAPPGPATWPQGEIAFFVEDPDSEHERLRRSCVTILAPPTTGPGVSGPPRLGPRRQRDRAHPPQASIGAVAGKALSVEATVLFGIQGSGKAIASGAPCRGKCRSRKLPWSPYINLFSARAGSYVD